LSYTRDCALHSTHPARMYKRLGDPMLSLL